MEPQTQSQALQPARLSFRERDVLELTSSGLANAEVARRLDVSIHAVKFHLASIYRKMGVSNRTEAAVRYLALSRQARVGDGLERAES